jgi:hypothetical protein
MQDIANVVLDSIHRELRIDEEWTVRGDRSFSWVGYRLRQDFVVGPAEIDADTEIFGVRGFVRVLEDVSADPHQIATVLGSVNRFAVGHALVWDGAAGRVICHTGAPVHVETLEWRPAQIADFGILGLRACEDIADALAEQLGGRVELWEHPGSGRRHAPDEMLTVGESVFAPVGHEKSRFAVEADMQRVYKIVENTRYYSAGADEGGLSIELPFGKDTMLVQLSSHEQHPLLGSGLLSTLKIRLPSDGAADVVRLAAEFNFREACGELPSVNFGATPFRWTVSDWGGPAGMRRYAVC